MGDIPQKFTSDDKELMRTLDKMHRKLVQLEQDNNRLARESEKASKKGKDGLSSMVVGAAKAAAGYMSVAGAVAALNSELRNKIALDNKARDTAVSTADAQAAAIKNLGDVDNATAKRFLADMRKLKGKAGFQSEAPILLAASSILSATGGDRKKTADIVAAAAPLFRDKQEDLATFGGAMGDVMKASGSTNAKQTAALMLAIQGQARFEDLAAFGNVAPALASAGVADTSGNKLRATREASALFAGIGQRAGDKEGAVTKTAVANLAGNLAEVVPEKQTAFERLAVVQQDAKLQEEVLRSGFKGSIKLVIQELVSNADSQTAGMVNDAFAKIKGSEAAYDRKVDQLQTLTPELTAAKQTRAAQAAQEGAELSDQAGAAQATMRDALEKAYKVNRSWAMTRWSSMKVYDTRVGMAGSIDDDAAAMHAAHAGAQERIRGMMTPLTHMQRPRTEREDEQLAALNALADVVGRAYHDWHAEQRKNAKPPLDPNRHVE